MEKDHQHVGARGLNAYEIDRYARIALNQSKLRAIGLKTLVNKELQKKSDQVAIGLTNKICEPEKQMNHLQPTLSETSGTMNVSNEKGRKEKQAQRNKRVQGSSAQTQLQNVNEGQETQLKRAKKIQQEQPQQTSKITPQEQEQVKKNYCPPGSHLKYVRMKKIEVRKGRQSAVDNLLGMLEEEVSLPTDDLSTQSDMIMHEGELQEDASDECNGVPNETDILVEEENPVTQKKKGRGRTILADVHNWEKRESIILDDVMQPVGPNKEIVDTFTRFLGTIAKESTLCPLNLKSWKYVPNKDNIWEYVKKRFDISELGKKYVLHAINADWRTYKSRIKRDHYYKYTTIKERLDNRPDNIPENHFRDLLKYWDAAGTKKISMINKENRQKQTDLHTMGPSSFAVLRAKMREDDPDKKDPPQVDVYIASRKRKDDRKYLTSDEETLQNIEKMKTLKASDDGSGKSDPYYEVINKKEHCGRVRLYGRGVTKSTLKKKDANTPYIFPPIFLESITKKLESNLDDILQKKIADVISKIQEANPGAELNIPSFEENISGEDDDGDAESTNPTH